MIRGAARRTPPFRFCVVVAREALQSDRDWFAALERVAAALALYPGGNVAVQVRPRGVAARDEVSCAEEAIRRLRRLAPDLTVLLNGAEPLAVALGYDGVHWREAMIPGTPPPKSWLRTASVHGMDALRRAEAAGVALVLFAPVWASTWKRSEPAGLDGLRAVTAVARVPVLALGGVTPERVVGCLTAGASGVAVAGAVLHREPGEAVARFERALGRFGRE